ncbi:cilia- and flagella-associated protein 52 [Amyelois transitella]|uniref:cilia- and flagella-associated protein 52 n=1 Tax=Amyelois transitella TaxID=680683 RepID=UPI0029907785|nr:cilia- and flagella-associated protein 52 [Amyelois transitella]
MNQGLHGTFDHSPNVMMEVKNLETYAIIGFDGSAIKGLKVHPDAVHVIYPMGNKVCIQDWKTKKMSFLSGHTNSVSTVAVSPKGTYVGSGQINHIGFKASAKVWDFKTRAMIGTHELHKVRVEALTFTSDERYMISLGGRDDGCVVLWDCVNGAATGTAAATKLTTGDAMTLTPLNLRSNSFVTGGDSNLRVWNIRAESKNLDVADVSLGKLRRSVRSIAISKDDSYGYAGTTTGDMIKFSINYPPDPMAYVMNIKPSLLGCLAKCGPFRKGKKPDAVCYSQGVEAILIMDDGCIIVGGGDGTIDILDEINWTGEFPKGKILDPCRPHFKALKTAKLDGCITSLEMMESPTKKGDKRLLLVGTRTSEIYAINMATFSPVLVVTCHRCAINDIAFPRGMSGVFATAGSGDVRVWCLETCQELLRIVVPNFVCSAVLFASDGKSIVTAWNDGNIRAFTPLTGRLVYCIFNTHNKGTSALDMTKDGRTLISGGCEGQVRVWDIKPEAQTLKKVLKEHKSPVSAIQVSPNDTEAVSAGTDGSAIIWDLVSLSRRQVMYANTLFMCICFEPLGCQLLTGGTDRRVAYWETGSGNLARELEASKVGAINGLDITQDGSLFVTGGNDQMVKLWKYQEGVYTHMGLGHAGAVTCCRFSPDARRVVSACAAGSVIVWRMPEQYLKQAPPSGRQAAPDPAPKTLEDELKLPLSEKPAQRAGGDRQHKIPSAPSKEEKIEAMDTSRSSVHSCCPCAATANSNTSSKKSTPKNTGSGKSCCRPPRPEDNLPTRTTSKEYVSSGGGDRK